VPIILATLGYASITLFQLPPVGHSCPSFAPAKDRNGRACQTRRGQEGDGITPVVMIQARPELLVSPTP
jgi:hypothetical protein